MIVKRFLNILALLFIVLVMQSQERVPVRVFYPEDYKGESQNWAISQTENGYIYIANNKGLLEYNGTQWNVYPSPNKTVMRSVKVINDTIYTGNYHDFGYWLKDEFGVLKYTSLSKKLNVKFLEDEEFWGITSVENAILFQSLDRIHIYNLKSKKYNIVIPEKGITRMFNVDNQVYFQTQSKHLYALHNGATKLVSSDFASQDILAINIFKISGKILVLTEKNGLFQLKGNDLLQYKKELYKNLNNYKLYSALLTKDDSFLLGTISNGLVKISNSGEVQLKIDQTNGLSNSTVLCLYEDYRQNIWLGLNDGVNCFNTISPYSTYIDNEGSLGSVYTSIVYNGLLYVGTNQGLYYSNLKFREAFREVKGTHGQVWFLGEVNGALFCGHNNGTFLITKDTSKKISDVKGTWQVKSILGDDTLLIQGHYDGFSILEKRDGEWFFKNKIEGFNISSRYFEFIDKSALLMSHEYKGVFKIKFNENYTRVVNVLKQTSVPKSLYSSLLKYENEILYSSKEGVFLYSNEKKVFNKDTLLSSLIDDKSFSSAKLVLDPRNNDLWSFNKESLRCLNVSSVTGNKQIKNISFPLEMRKDIVGFEHIMSLDKSKYLIGSRYGYHIFNPEKPIKKNYNLFLNRILVSQFKDQQEIQLVKIFDKGYFANYQHNITFKYSVPEYLDIYQPKYSYKLEGIYDEWSEWSNSGEVFFENLPYGNYSFKVRGKIGDKLTNNTINYEFSIARPWYLSVPMLIGYALAVLLFSLFMHQVYKSYYKKQRKVYLEKKNRELELKELENEQERMKFRNEKLQQDIESKSRELGISTMSLIKKNEVLTELRKVIATVKNLDDLKKVDKIIEKNLSDSNDWKVFEEAFSNVDKDFLKKMKEMHPELTANDLRLCTYLRLNLSSKEIAPLLSISPKSVEVKRYRLRKKLNLEHEDGLTEYILQV